MDVFKIGDAQFDAAQDMIVRWIRNELKPFEPVTRPFILDNLARADLPGCFVDVGASTGWYTVPAALLGRRVIAFEPNQRVVTRLYQNITLNGVLDLVEVNEVACSSSAGETTFYYNPLVPLTSGGSIEAATCRNPRTETVKVVRLDDVIDEPVAFLKIDVENHERHVLEGALGIIEKWRPYMVLEANSEGFRAALAHMLFGLGYTFEEADERNLLCRPIR